MANADFPPGAFFKHATVVPRVVTKATRQRDEERQAREAYKTVDLRDKHTCRATGRPVVAGAVDPRMRLERHHIQKRSTHKDKRYDSRNIVTVCAQIHQLLEAHALEIEGTNADQRLVFHWNRAMVPVGTEPCKLLSKRRSANR